ncbi:MAG: NAD(P) transhydrogenase subunit alpha [Bacteroidetes bacterium RIFCSPHIGHO2_02_FULL_44_7]|nr:MAG: NAD(P) transhydrogenase subunit alpha [Bacteroidetes bacterium RIFCSPHIGHO2_02_FULL_44_7]
MQTADIVLKVNIPQISEIEMMKPNAVYIGFIFHLFHPEIVESACKQQITMFSMDAIPRISRAQKMDALSSQSNLAGYKTVIMAGNSLGRIFPMMMTAAGTITPAKVLIMGAGVAGLQAIATAKRLGAIVEVSDIRKETKEQVESLGARFIEVKSDENLATTGGYAKEVSSDFLKKQQELISKHVAEADIVITTALVPGKKAPILVTEDMVKSMKQGSVIVDMAVEQGGNCPLSELNKTVQKHGVCIIGESNIPSLLPKNSSELYAKNISSFLFHITENNTLKIDPADEITKGAMVVHEGKKC